MNLVVLCSGKGNRLKPITYFKPKHLIKIKGRTMVKHTVDSALATLKEKPKKIVFTITPHDMDNSLTALEFGVAYHGIPCFYEVQRSGMGQLVALNYASNHLSGGVAVLNSDTVMLPKKQISTKGKSFLTMMKADLSVSGHSTWFEKGEIMYLSKKAQFPDTGWKWLIGGLYYFNDGARLKEVIRFILKRADYKAKEYSLSSAINRLIVQRTPFADHHINFKDLGTRRALFSAIMRP